MSHAHSIADVNAAQLFCYAYERERWSEERLEEQVILLIESVRAAALQKKLRSTYLTDEERAVLPVIQWEWPSVAVAPELPAPPEEPAAVPHQFHCDRCGSMRPAAILRNQGSFLVCIERAVCDVLREESRKRNGGT